MDSEEQQMVLQSIGRQILEVVPEDWDRIVMNYSGVVELSSWSLEVVRSDGEVESAKLPLRASVEMNSLRAGMHQEGKGTWFSARFVMERPGKFHVEFDYDNEPPFPYELDPERYAADYRYFPRKWENIPQWLRKKLRASLDNQKDLGS
jgi:hypothetical protein